MADIDTRITFFVWYDRNMARGLARTSDAAFEAAIESSRQLAEQDPDFPGDADRISLKQGYAVEITCAMAHMVDVVDHLSDSDPEIIEAAERLMQEICA